MLGSHLQDVCSQYRTGAYLLQQLDWEASPQPDAIRVPPLPPGDKVIVMAKLEEEYTGWVEEELRSTWQRAIYVVNPSSETRSNDEILTTPFNKGHEAMAYLTYVIDYYDKLPSTIVFLHAHRSASTCLSFSKTAMSTSAATGTPAARSPTASTPTSPTRSGGTCSLELPPPPMNTSDPYQVSQKGAQRLLRKPDLIGAACCAQFAVSRSQVHRRPRDDYVKFRQWLVDTSMNDASSGRVMEFMWHVIFGMEAVYCPEEELCYCQVYGKC
ncbi:hypothetical protein N7468_007999 [Penicillium chermesinum]|uniref:Uncharacterized protein n=1 Tax=Penicillium chermesinum TaxID=63820 RepID=A0A9W9THV6_9EURO|nr:uncharacterized protein N7468_007999 [Penicillium chermesinum]KAJ5223457.1 hypothetical protein N7468_007999 [Penicillium chermesinum]